MRAPNRPLLDVAVAAILWACVFAQTLEDIPNIQRENTGLVGTTCSPSDNCYLYQINNGFPFALDFSVDLACDGAVNNTQTHTVTTLSNQFCIQPGSGGVQDRLCELVLRYEDPYLAQEVVGATFTDSCGQIANDDEEDYPSIQFGSPLNWVFWLAIILAEVLFSLPVIVMGTIVRDSIFKDTIYAPVSASNLDVENIASIPISAPPTSSFSSGPARRNFKKRASGKKARVTSPVNKPPSEQIRYIPVS